MLFHNLVCIQTIRILLHGILEYSLTIQYCGGAGWCFLAQQQLVTSCNMEMLLQHYPSCLSAWMNLHMTINFRVQWLKEVIIWLMKKMLRLHYLSLLSYQHVVKSKCRMLKRRHLLTFLELLGTDDVTAADLSWQSELYD